MKRAYLTSLALVSATGLLIWTSKAFAYQNKCKLNNKPEKCLVEPNRGHAFTVKFPRLGITYEFSAQGSTWGDFLQASRVQGTPSFKHIPMGFWKVMQNHSTIEVSDPSSKILITVYK